MKDTDKKIKKQEPRKSIRLRRHSAKVLKKAGKSKLKLFILLYNISL